MSLIITVLIGALIGWLASLIMKTDAKQGALLNILIGIAGAWLGKWLFGGVLGLGQAYVAGRPSIPGIAWGVIGAVILIAILRAIGLLK
jgi:uncharacterized membrane protein YeaQ/YmgE (transglycosylase-associated protein family)